MIDFYLIFFFILDSSIYKKVLKVLEGGKNSIYKHSNYSLTILTLIADNNV